MESHSRIFPFGSFEQHGPHLPLTTDTDIVTAIARRIEQERASKVLCLPTLWPGHSTHHLFFPGTLSVSQMPYIRMVIELCRSVARMGAQKIFLLKVTAETMFRFAPRCANSKPKFQKHNLSLPRIGRWPRKA